MWKKKGQTSAGTVKSIIRSVKGHVSCVVGECQKADNNDGSFYVFLPLIVKNIKVWERGKNEKEKKKRCEEYPKYARVLRDKRKNWNETFFFFGCAWQWRLRVHAHFKPSSLNHFYGLARPLS